jgi:hypothetical protein
MFCPGCGSENTAQSAFCTKCGTNLSQLLAGQGFAGPPPPVIPGVPAPPAPLPYLWGYIHGWGMLVTNPLLFLLFLAVLLDPKSDSETRLGCAVLMVLLGLGTLTGVGLVRKSKLGMILVFVWTGLHLFFVGIFLLALVAKPHDRSMAIALLLMVAGLGFWSLCSVYYYRRRFTLR